MSKLVTSGQRLVTGVMYPRGVYSRVIDIGLVTTDEVGNTKMAVTPVVAQTVWLLGINLHICPVVVDLWTSGFLWLKTGTTKESNISTITGTWEDIIDMSTLFKNAIMFYGKTFDLSLRMNKLYTGVGRRFAIVASNGAAVQMWCNCCFEISEG